MKTDWKIVPVLLPGALLGAGAGALVTAFQFPWAAGAASTLQTAGIVIMIGSIVLRIGLSQAGFSLADYGGLFLNGACVFLSGLATIGALTLALREGEANAAELAGALALAWIPCLLLTAFVAAAYVRLRRRPTARKED